MLTNEVRSIVKAGHSVFVEAGAGEGVAIADSAYEAAGAIIYQAANTRGIKGVV